MNYIILYWKNHSNIDSLFISYFYNEYMRLIEIQKFFETLLWCTTTILIFFLLIVNSVSLFYYWKTEYKDKRVDLVRLSFLEIFINYIFCILFLQRYEWFNIFLKNTFPDGEITIIVFLPNYYLSLVLWCFYFFSRIPKIFAGYVDLYVYPDEVITYSENIVKYVDAYYKIDLFVFYLFKVFSFSVMLYYISIYMYLFAS